MFRFRIQGPTRLEGEVPISGSKNASLAIIPAAILLDEPVLLRNIPDIEDVRTILSIMESLGATVIRETRNDIRIDPTTMKSHEVPYFLASRMRASIYTLGPLLVKFGRGVVYMPGGCSFGPRPIDFHIDGLKKMGANISIEHGNIVASVEKFRSAHINLPFKSVGATIHLMTTAVKLKGIRTVISNAALEPEVVDTANFLNRAGARIYNAGFDEIIIEGVDKLTLDEYRVIPDRIEAGSFAVAGAMAGEILLDGVIKEHVISTLDRLEEAGAMLRWVDERRLLVKKPEGRIRPLMIKTAPFPGFPTDMQAQFMAMLTVADGTSIIKEGIYPSRFHHAYELQRMGADIKVDHGEAVVNGVEKLMGAIVNATDLRASISLVLAGIIAEGETIVENIEHIDRGYEEVEKKFNSLGARIEREVSR